MLVDAAFAALIIVAGILSFSALSGVAAASEIVRARREQRARLAEIRCTQSKVWARQLQRNLLGRPRCGTVPDP